MRNGASQALAARFSKKIARATLQSLQKQYPTLLSDAAVSAFDKRLPQNVAQCSATILRQLIATNGPVDMLGGSWECQSVSRAGRQRGTMDPRFHYFYDLVRIINFFKLEQATPMIYIIKNTYPGAKEAHLNCRPLVHPEVVRGKLQQQ